MGFWVCLFDSLHGRVSNISEHGVLRWDLNPGSDLKILCTSDLFVTYRDVELYKCVLFVCLIDWLIDSDAIIVVHQKVYMRMHFR